MVRIEQIEVVIADIQTVRPHVLAMTTMHSQPDAATVPLADSLSSRMNIEAPR